MVDPIPPLPGPPRLDVARDLSEHQKQWGIGLKDAVARGEHFAICSSDEFEEIFHLLGIHPLVVNYWHSLVVATGNARHYTKLLADRGYDMVGMGPLGYAAAIDPSLAPWGGLPKPLIMLGSTRDEGEFHFMELWAKEFGCPYYPLDFNLSGPYRRPPGDGWWDRLRSDWQSVVDPHQLDLRVAEVQGLIGHLEQVTGRSFSNDDLCGVLDRINIQMDLWTEALELLGDAPLCPVTLRDQLAMYQAMWHRGTDQGIAYARRFRDEVAQRVDAGIGAYHEEKYRLLFWSGDHEPRFHRYLQHRHGAAFVGNVYSGTPGFYARDYDPRDPLRALCSRNLFLIAHETPQWMISIAGRLRCDAVIARERSYPRSPRDAGICEAAGIPYLNVPHLADDAEVRELLDRFIEEKVAPAKAARV